MNNGLSWGAKLQLLRKRHKLSQDRFADELSCFHLLLSEEEQSIYSSSEVEFYVSLDKTAISDYENGNRKIPERRRLLFFICYFHKKGKITLEEANTWLYSAGLLGLSSQERKVIFGDEEIDRTPEFNEEERSSHKEDLKNMEKERKTIFIPSTVDVISIDRKKFPLLREVLIVFVPIQLIALLFTGNGISLPATKHKNFNDSQLLEQARQAEESLVNFTSENTPNSFSSTFVVSSAVIGPSCSDAPDLTTQHPKVRHKMGSC